MKNWYPVSLLTAAPCGDGTQSQNQSNEPPLPIPGTQGVGVSIDWCIRFLRTVPTKYKGFCARLGPCGKARSLQGLLESTKKNRGSCAFLRDN